MTEPTPPVVPAATLPRQRRRQRRFGALAVVLALVAFIAINVVASFGLRDAKADLTEDRLYTISEGTKTIMRDLKERISIRFYVSRALTDAVPAYAQLDKRVRDLLDDYARLSGGKISVEVITPEPFSPEEDQAAQQGIRARPINSDGDLGFFGIVARNSTDRKRELPALDPSRETLLEADLTKLIYELTQTERVVVGVIDGMGLTADPQQGRPPSTFMTLLERGYDMRVLSSEVDAIDPAVKVLLVIHPAGLSTDTIYAIDQYALGGGRVLLFVDPNAESAPPDEQMLRMGLTPPQGGPSSIPALYKAWGIDVSTEQVVGDSTYGLRVPFPVNGREQVVQLLHYLAVEEDGLIATDPITGQLRNINMLAAGHIIALPDATTKIEPLVQSSDKAGLIPTADVSGMRPDPLDLLAKFKPTGERYVLAARVTGDVKSAFDQPPPAPEGKERAPHKAASEKPLQVIIVADADMLADRAWVEPQAILGQRVQVQFANNGDFAFNAIDTLSGSDALLSLRGRGLGARPFRRVEAIRDAAEAKYRDEEKQLRDRLTELQQKAEQIFGEEGEDSGREALVTPEQTELINQIKSDRLETRAKLRRVQQDLLSDVRALGTTLTIINIAAVPALMCAIALVLTLVRRAKARGAARRRLD